MLEYKLNSSIGMLNSHYFFIISSILIAISFAIYFLNSSRPYKNSLNNKILLKNLLEGLDMDLPEEL